MAYPLLRCDAGEEEPTHKGHEAVRLHRKRRLALAYRLFGAMKWGTLGDGHISARDPEKTDCFWLLRYGVPFGEARVSDLVLVGPDGKVLEGEGDINITAFYIHGPIHEKHPRVTCCAHTHTPYGTPWCATARPFSMLCQEATAFFEKHAVFDDEEVQVMGTEGGKRMATIVDGSEGGTKGLLLRNHGLLSLGGSVDEAVGWFLFMERVSEIHIKAGDRAKPIGDDAARTARDEGGIGDAASAWHAFQFALRANVPDPTVVDE